MASTRKQSCLKGAKSVYQDNQVTKKKKQIVITVEKSLGYLSFKFVIALGGGREVQGQDDMS